jgi:hypothetical protein
LALANFHCQMHYEIEEGGTAISLSQRSLPSLPRCAIARPPRQWPAPRRSRAPEAIRCVIPRTRRWATAPTRQKASDVIGAGYAGIADNAPRLLAAPALPAATAF